LLLIIFSGAADASADQMKSFQATCPTTAYLSSNGAWSSGVRFNFDRAEIYVYNDIPQHLRCWYKSPVGGNAFLASHNEVREGYECVIVDNNKFVCKEKK
jgi:hypothetical protein